MSRSRNMNVGWNKTRQYIVWRDGGICWICGNSGATSADHIIPRAKGGTDDFTNLRCAHKECNQKRGTHTVQPPIARISRFT